MDIVGQVDVPMAAIWRTWPGFVFDWRIQTDKIVVDSWISDHCNVEELAFATVNSLALRNPKKETVKAAHMRHCSRSERLETRSCLFKVCSRFMVIGSLWLVESSYSSYDKAKWFIMCRVRMRWAVLLSCRWHVVQDKHKNTGVSGWKWDKGPGDVVLVIKL